MGAAAEKYFAADAGIDLADQSLKSGASATQPSQSFKQSSFSSTEDFRAGVAGAVVAPAEERVSTTFLAIFNQEVVRKMWLSSQGAHVTLSEGLAGEHIVRVIDTLQEGKGVASQITFDQKPTLSVSPDGQTFIVATGEMVAEYAIEAGGNLKARPVHLASEGQVIIGAKYRGDEVVISSRRAGTTQVA